MWKGDTATMNGVEVLGAALITWLKDTEETDDVAQKVVGTVWPLLCRGQSQRHLAVVTSCKYFVQDGAH